ncbi:tumor necrosis factor receptor superfamily member 14, partial [Rhynchocyon petersi]
NFTLALPTCKEEEYPVGAECCPKCSPGYRVKQACDEDRGTVCVPCLPGTYTAHLNGLQECLPCRICDSAMHLETRRKCSTTKNTECGCQQGYFCETQSTDACVTCQSHSSCGPGQQVLRNGTDMQDTVCEACPAGTFSSSETLHRCHPWTKPTAALKPPLNPTYRCVGEPLLLDHGYANKAT